MNISLLPFRFIALVAYSPSSCWLLNIHAEWMEEVRGRWERKEREGGREGAEAAHNDRG